MSGYPREKHIGWLKDSSQWHRWPICPVKRYDGKEPSGFPSTGVVIDGTPTVYMVNMFMFDGVNNSKLLEECERFEYESIEAMVDDGWVVD